MEESDLNPPESGEPQPQVLYVSGNTYYTTAEGEGQEPMVTYMYGDEQSAETQYMMIEGGDGEGVLQGAGDHYMMTTSDGGVQYVLVSDDMATSAQPQFVLDQSGMEGQMTIMQNVLNDQMVSGVGMTSTEAMQLPEMASEVPAEVDFLNSVEPVVVNPTELTSDTDFSSDLGSAVRDQFEPESSIDDKYILDVTKMEVQDSEKLVPEPESTKLEPTTGLEEPQPDESVSSEVKPVAKEPDKLPAVAVVEKQKPRAFENVTRSIHVTSVPIPSSSKESKPIITVKPSPVSHLDGDRIKIETSGGVQKVFILPMNPQSKTATSTSSNTLPVRFISQEQMSSFPVQTITLPLKSNALAGNLPKQIRPAVTVSTGPRTSASILAPNIIKRGVGRPPLKDRLKSPQMQSAGPVKIRPASSQVIVIPIQVSKDSAGLTPINGANTQVTPSGSGAPRVKAMLSASEKTLKGVKKGGILKTKMMPKFTKKQAAKLLDDDDTPSSTRRSKRQNNMSMKLAEWGLLPTGGRSSSSSEDDEEDELDFDDDEDDEEDEPDDDNESNSSISLGIYAKSAQKGTRKLVTVDDKRFSTPQVAKVSMGSKAPVRVLPGSAPVKRTVPSGTVLQAPKEMQNKSLMCKPIMMTKATSCNPIRLTKDTQTEKDEGDIIKIPIPIPVPLFVPAPVSMGTRPVPVPVPLPVPVLVPALMPITKNSISNILKQLKSIRESLPAEEENVLKVADAVAESNQEGAEAGVEDKAVVKQEPTGEEAIQMSSYLQQLPLEVVEMAMQIATQITDDSSDDAALDGTAGESMELGTNTLDDVCNLAGAKKHYALDEGSRPSKRICIEPDQVKATLRRVPVNDTRMKLKYSYGLNAWWHWVTQRNAQMELSASEVQGRFKPFKVEILQCSAEELNHCLSLFIREVRKPSGEEYAPDSIFYLCLGIQHYLYENNRIDSLFHDTYYSKFAEALNDLLSGFEVRLNAHGQIVCRVTEEHLWESRQLGVHSPHILLNTLVYFNTKHFMLNSTEGHLGLSFSNIMKQWKKNTMTSDGRAARTVYLRYNANGPVVTPTTNAAEAQRRKSLETMPYEQLENPENPLRCPVKLYEFYLSKCPESIKHRNDMFYLIPEPSCVPDSPVWYSTTTLGAEALSKMLNRIRVVREIQESQINQIPAYYS